MKKMTLNAILSLWFIIPVIGEAAEAINNYSLEQVVVFSRHGLRAPLSSPESTLGKVTPNQWPKWDTAASYLTLKGGVLEAYFGHYFSEWLADNKLLDMNLCPKKDDIYIYTNSMQRTIATGQYFAVGAFPGCNVPVVYKMKFNTMDPVFAPVITDGSNQYKKNAIHSMNNNIGDGGVEGLNERLKPAYKLLEKIINYKESPNCLTEHNCDFTLPRTQLIIEKGKEPGVTGPLRTGTSIADAFILQYYEGTPLNKIAWGKIKTEKELKSLVDIKENYNNLLFSSPAIAKHVAENLISYIKKTFSNSDNSAKFTLLVGHDSNVASLLSSMEISGYSLPGQFETTPIGGKVVFQKWKNNKTNEYFMKIDYFYQSTQQIRKLEPLSRHNPPQQVTLQMKNCPTDSMGFCPMTQFEKILNNIIQ